MFAPIRVRSAATACRFTAFLAALAGCAPAGAAEPDVATMERALDAGASDDAAAARKLAEEAVEACGPGMVSKPCRLATRTLLARGFATRSLYALALEQARETHALAATTSQAAQLTSLLTLATAAARAGELDEAEQAITDGRALAAELARTADGAEAVALLALRGMFGGPQALIYTARGEHVRAAASQRALLEAMRSFDPEPGDLAIEMLALGDLEAAAADPRAAREAYAEATRLAGDAGNTVVRDKARAGLARLQVTHPR